MRDMVSLMNLHTPGEQPDWIFVKSQDRNRWQKLAASSSGILTPSNIISIVGLILVLFGLVEIVYSNYFSGSIFIAFGRIFDLLDGYVAELTRTKSPLGETLDTTIDKIEIFTALIAIYIASILPDWVWLVMLLISLWVSLAALLARHRQIDLHPSLEGKLATAAIWTSLILFLISNSLDSPFAAANTPAYLFFGVFVWLGCVSAVKYAREIVYSGLLTGQKFDRFDGFAVVLNPKSSNAKRANLRIKELGKVLPKKLQVISISQKPGSLQHDLKAWLQKNGGQTVIMIGGGDGTVHSVINALINLGDLSKNVVVLPIWGGNANDFAYMLNGPSYSKKIFKVLARGQIIDINPLEIKISHKNKISVRYAACYASFGASAFVAHQLDQRMPAAKNRFFSTPLVLAFKEVWGVTDAFKKAPVFSAEINGEKVTIFEEAFMNGPRIAKINTVPLKLTDKAYYHAHQPNKHPLLSRRFVQALTGRRFGKTTSRPTTFTLKETTVGQFDGEVSRIKEGSKITVSLASLPIKALSLKHSKSSQPTHHKP